MGPFSEGFAACGEDLSHHRDELGVVILCEDPYGLAQSCKISEEEEQEDELGQHAESSGRVVSGQEFYLSELAWVKM